MKKLLLSIVTIFFYTGCTPWISDLDPRTGITQAVTHDYTDRTYYEAVEYCKNLRLGGYSDWRLPTLEESVGTISRKYQKQEYCDGGYEVRHWASDDGEGRTKMTYTACGREGGIVPIAKAGVDCVRKP